MTTQTGKIAFIAGASQGIGLALVRNLLESRNFQKIFASHRPGNDPNALYLLKEKYQDQLTLVSLDAENLLSFEAAVEHVAQQVDQIDFCINAIGTLKDHRTFPERRIEEVEPSSLTWAFQVNTVPTLLLAKHLKPFFRKSPNLIFAALSAKVGSIDDNKTGGWYSYRISKTALNMVIKNLSIEFGRICNNSVFVALHPGTTKTRLTEEFLSSAAKKYRIHEPHETAINLLDVLAGLDPRKDSGKFFSWDGSELPW